MHFCNDSHDVCACYSGETSFINKTEVDSGDDNSKPFLCSVCGKRFMQKNSLCVHESMHDGEKLYSCIQCENQLIGLHHLKKYTVLDSSTYECTECGKSCGNSRQLAVHKRNHSREKVWECDVCGKHFAHFWTLRVHNRMHTGDQPYKCHLCDRAFSQLGNLQAHVRVHAGIKPYKCPTCDKAFSQHINMKVHMRVHTGDKPYICHVCDKAFTQLGNLQMHMANHTGVKSYNIRSDHCSYCGMQFDTRHDLKRHESIHPDAKPYSCKHCSDCFRRRVQLKTHLLKSHNEGTWLACHICEKKFTLKSILKSHIRRHEGVKPYVCSDCYKCFCTSCELRSHQLIHSDVRQFCCFLCNKYFKRKYEVVHHFKRCSAKLGFGHV